MHYGANQSLNDSLTNCDLQPENPWCGKFGGQQIFEVIYLAIVAVVGTFGNLLVIFSIIFEKRMHKAGNMFIINLAVADLIVTGIYIPTVIANVFETGNALPMLGCQIVGYLITVTCVCSVCNLTFIAVNRYWSVVRRETYHKVFSVGKVWWMVLFTWLWSNLIVTPTLYGWTNLYYDPKMMMCSWNDLESIAYNIILMGSAIILPILVITFCYWKLFRNVRNRGRYMRRQTVSSISFTPSDKKKRSLQRELNLLKTLATAVLLFIICWGPYGICILGIARTAPYQAKKIFGWLGLSNSFVNFIIYGAMNRVYRKGYKRFLIYIFCCVKRRRDKRLQVMGAVAYPALDQVAVHTNKRKGAIMIGNNSRSNSFSSTVTVPSKAFKTQKWSPKTSDEVIN